MTKEHTPEQKEYIDWIERTVPYRYRSRNKTQACYTIPEDFTPLRNLGLTQKSLDLMFANKKRENKLYHLFDEKNPCDRCLRMLSATAIFNARKHPELFTPGAQEIMDLEDKERERERLKENYEGDGLYLIEINSPFIGGDTNLHDTHLVFYDETSVRHGKRRMKKRIANGDPKNLVKLAQFTDIRPYQFKGNQDIYFMARSQDFFPKEKGHNNTIIEIVSHKDKSF